jgi:hypothetical protein
VLSLEQILWSVVVLLVALMLLTRSLTRRAECVVPPLGRFVDLPLARLHLVDQGPTDGADGPVLILIHGLGGQLRHFSYALIEHLSRTIASLPSTGQALVTQHGAVESAPLLKCRRMWWPR